MDNQFSLLLKAAIDLQKSQTDINAQITQLQKGAKELNIELSTVNAKKALKELSVEAQTALGQNKVKLDNNITAYIKNNTKLSKDLVSELENVKTKISSVDSSGLKQLGNEFRTITSKANALGQTGDTVFNKLQKNALQFLNYLGSATLVMGSIRVVQNMVSEVKNLDSAMIDLRKVTDESDSTYNNFLNNAANSAKRLGSEISSVVSMTAEWARAGYNLKDSAKLAEISTIFQNVADVDVKTSVSDIITPLKAFNLEASKAIDVVNALNEVDNKFSVSAADIGDGLKNSASALALAGNDLNQSIALITGGSEITQNADEMGNAIKVLSMRLRGMKGDLESIGEEYEDILPVSKIQTQIYNLTKGTVNIMDDLDPTKFKSTYEIIQEISKVWSQISETDQAQLLEIVAGKQRGNQVAALIQSFESGQSQKALETAIGSTNSALNEQERYMKSIKYSADRMKASFQELSNNTINSSWVKGFYDLSNVLISIIDKIGIFNIALIALVGIVGTKTTLGMTAFQGVLEGIIVKMGVSTAAAETLGMALSTMIPTALIIGGVTAIVKIYEHYNVTLEETQAKLEKQKEIYDDETLKVQSLTKELGSAKSKLEELNKIGGAKVAKDGEKEKLEAQTEELQRQLDIAKEAQRIAKLDAEETATKTLGTKIESKYNSKEVNNDYAGYSVKYDKVTRDVELERTMAEYDELSNSYTELEKKQQSLSKAHKGNSKEYKNNQMNLDLLSKSMKNAQQYASGLATDMQTESENLVGATVKGNDMKTTIDNSLDSYNAWTKKINEANSSLGETGTVSDKANNGIAANANAAQEAATKLQETNDTIDDYQKKMGDIKNALSDVSKLSTSDIMDFMQQHPTFDWEKYGVTGAAGVGDLTGAFKALGVEQYDTIAQSLGARDSFKALYDETVNVTDAVDTYGNTLNSAIGSISKFNSSLSSMDSAYASLSQKQSVSVEDIAALSETFGNISGFDNFINTISSAKSMTSDVQNAFNSLVGTYIETSGVLNDLDDSNKDLIITQLQHIGITNAEEIVTKQLAQQKAILAETGVDVKNATADEIIELIKEGNVSEDTKIALANLAAQKLNVNNIALSTSGDIQNLISLMSLTNATTEALQALQAAKAGDVPMSVSKPGDMQSMISRAQNEVDAYYKGLGNYQNVKYSGGDKTKSAADKQNKANDKTKKDFSQVFDWIEIRIDKLKEKAQKAIDDVGKYIKLKDKNDQLKVAIDTQVDEKKSLTSLMKSYNKMADKVKLPKKYQDLVNNGGFNVQTIKNEALAKKIEEYQKWKEAAAGVAAEIKQINDKIKELNAQKLTNITEYFGDRNDYISAKISRKESEVSLKTDSGKSPTKHDYKALIKLQNDDKKNSQKELAAYTKQFNEQVKNGDITKNSPEYLKGLSEINDLTKAINESQSAVYNYKKEIRELDWKGFDKGITKVNNIKNELSDLSDLIKDSEILDDKGNYTEAGLTKLGLLSQQMNANTKLASEYGEAIKKIGRELKNGTITQDQYNEELANYQSLQRQAVKDNQALEDSISEIAKQRVQYEIDAINKETDAFKDLIDAKKEALQAEKDLHDYQESINKKQQSINTLQKQIAALKLSTDRSDIAQRLKLEKDLKDQQADLDEEQYQHSVETQSDALDDEYDAYKKTQDEKVTALEKSLNDQEALVKSALDEVYANTTEISTGIQTLASEHGLTVSESVVSPWENAIAAIEAYRTALASLPVSNELDGAISGAGIGAGIGSSLNGVSGSSSNGTSSQKSTKDSSSVKTSTTNSNSKLPIGTVKYTGNKSSLNKDSSIVDRLKYYDLDSSLSARTTLFKHFGLSGSYMGTDSQNAKLIAAMKKAGFSKGGTGKLVNSLEDEGFTLMKRDEAMLSSEQTEQFKQLLGYAPMIKPAIDSISGNNTYPNIQNNNPVNVHYDNLINIEGNADSSNIKQLELIAQKAVEKGNQTLISFWNQKH